MVSSATTSAPGGMLPISCVNRLERSCSTSAAVLPRRDRLLEALARRLPPIDLADDAPLADGEREARHRAVGRQRHQVGDGERLGVRFVEALLEHDARDAAARRRRARWRRAAASVRPSAVTSRPPVDSSCVDCIFFAALLMVPSKVLTGPTDGTPLL